MSRKKKNPVNYLEKNVKFVLGGGKAYYWRLLKRALTEVLHKPPSVQVHTPTLFYKYSNPRTI